MKYWRVRTEQEKNIRYKGIDEKNYEKMFPYVFGEGEIANTWDNSVTICINQKKSIIEYTDVPMLSARFFLVNEKMLNLLLEYAKDEFEVLHINCVEGDYKIVNVTDKIDCIDMNKSIYKVWKGDKNEIQFYDKLYLKKDKLCGKHLCRAEHTSNTFFLCSDTLKNEIESKGIIGLRFELID